MTSDDWAVELHDVIALTAFRILCEPDVSHNITAHAIASAVLSNLTAAGFVLIPPAGDAPAEVVVLPSDWEDRLCLALPFDTGEKAVRLIESWRVRPAGDRDG